MVGTMKRTLWRAHNMAAVYGSGPKKVPASNNFFVPSLLLSGRVKPTGLGPSTYARRIDKHHKGIVPYGHILPEDYDRAMRKIVPASQRCGASPARPLSVTVRPLLCHAVERALVYLQRAFATGLHKSSIAQRLSQDGNQTDDSSVFSDDEAMDSTPAVDLASEASDRQSLIPSIRSRFGALASGSGSHRPRLLVCGRPGLGQTTHVAPAVLHLLEHLPLHRLDLPALHSFTARAPEEACAQVLQEAQRVLPGVLYLPHVCQWWETLGDAVRATFLTLLSDLEPLTPVLWLATADVPFDQLPTQVQQLFGPSEVLELRAPMESERRRFFAPVFARAAATPRPKRPTPEQMPSLPAAPPPEPRKLTPTELERLRQQEEATLRELRLFLRDILTKLMRDRRYSMFAKPVDASEVPDYLEVIREPMDLETMMGKIDRHQYQTVAHFLQDIELICSNALEYNPDRDPMDKNIRHRACALQDAAHALVDTELDWGFEKICQDIVQARKERGEESVPYVPKNYYVVPRTAQPATNGPADDPAQVDASGEDGRKRFSRRLRGMEVVPSENEEDTAGNTTDATQEADDAEGGSTQTSASQQPTAEVADAPVEHQSTKPAEAGRDKVTATRAATKRRRSSSDGGSKNSDSSRPQAAAKEKPLAANKRLTRSSSPDQTEDSSESQHKQVAPASKGRASEVSCNGPVAEEALQKRELQLNRGWLEELEERTVAQTEGATVEQLERLHCALLNVVRRHRRSWDRNVMLQEMSQQLDSFRVLLQNQAAT